MWSRRRLVSLAALTLGCALVGTWSRAQEGDAPADEFQGKYLMIVKKSDPDYSINLEKARVRTLGDSRFLVGVGADDAIADNWQAGLTIWIALDDISEITVFDSLDDLRDVVGGLDLRVARHER
jgi:hypothetical protein